MERTREAPERLHEHRVHRRQQLLDALARADRYRDRARAWGDARLVARYQAEIRRAEATLAALAVLDAAIAAEAQP